MNLVTHFKQNNVLETDIGDFTFASSVDQGGNWICPRTSGHCLTLRLLIPLHAGMLVVSGISTRYGGASRCSARTRWPSCLRQWPHPASA